MASFPRNVSPSSASTSDQSDFDVRYSSPEYGEPTMVSEHNGPYWTRPARENEIEAALEETQRRGREIREGSIYSEQVPHEYEVSYCVDHKMSSDQQSPSQGCHDEELQELRASAEEVVQSFQQKATEVNKWIQEDLARLDSLITEENSRAQLEIEAESAELYPRAIPQSDSEGYAPGISYDMYLRMRTTMCGKITPSKLEPGQPPIRQIIRTKEMRRFPCPICRQRRTRMWHVESHFPGCAKINGNPRGLHWFDHPTILNHYKEGTRFNRRRIGTDPRGPRVEVPEDAWDAYRTWRFSFDNSPFVRESIPKVSWNKFLDWTDKQAIAEGEVKI